MIPASCYWHKVAKNDTISRKYLHVDVPKSYYCYVFKLAVSQKRTVQNLHVNEKYSSINCIASLLRFSPLFQFGRIQ